MPEGVPVAVRNEFLRLLVFRPEGVSLVLPEGVSLFLPEGVLVVLRHFARGRRLRGVTHRSGSSPAPIVSEGEATFCFFGP